MADFLSTTLYAHARTRLPEIDFVKEDDPAGRDARLEDIELPHDEPY